MITTGLLPTATDPKRAKATITPNGGNQKPGLTHEKPYDTAKPYKAEFPQWWKTRSRVEE